MNLVCGNAHTHETAAYCSAGKLVLFLFLLALAPLCSFGLYIQTYRYYMVLDPIKKCSTPHHPMTEVQTVNYILNRCMRGSRRSSDKLLKIHRHHKRLRLLLPPSLRQARLNGTPSSQNGRMAEALSYDGAGIKVRSIVHVLGGGTAWGCYGGVPPAGKQRCQAGGRI